MNATYRVSPNRVHPPLFAIALLMSSALWFASSWACYATRAPDWLATPLLWMTLVVITPAVCFAIGVILVGTRKRAELSLLSWCAFVAAFLPVTLGSWLAVRAVKMLLSMSGVGL